MRNIAIKLVHSEKATIFMRIFHFYLKLHIYSNVAKHLEIFSNFCGLHGIYELYQKKSVANAAFVFVKPKLTF